MRDYVEGKLLFNHPPPSVAPNSEAEREFVRASVRNNMATCKKLRDKFEEMEEKEEERREEERRRVEEGGVEGEDGNDEEIDLDILDFVSSGAGEEETKKTGGNRGKAHKTMKGWAKKGKKLRDKDPYGCHKDGGEGILLDAARGQGSGVHVAAGKSKGRRRAAEKEDEGYRRPEYNAKNAGAVPGERVVK